MKKKVILCLVQQLGDFGFSDWLVDSLEVSEEGGMVAWGRGCDLQIYIHHLITRKNHFLSESLPGKDLAGSPTAPQTSETPQNYAVPAVAAVCSCRRKKTPELQSDSDRELAVDLPDFVRRSCIGNAQPILNSPGGAAVGLLQQRLLPLAGETAAFQETKVYQMR